MKLFEGINTGLMLILTIVATIATVKSCEITKEVQSDDRQLSSLKGVILNQEDQLKKQTKELTELIVQTNLMSEELMQMQRVNSELSLQTSKLSKQLQYSQKEQDSRNHHQILLTKEELFNLKQGFDNMMFLCDTIRTQATTSARQTQFQFFKQVLSFLENKSQFEVLLDDSSMFFEWGRILVDAQNASNNFSGYIHDSTDLDVGCRSSYDWPLTDSSNPVQVKERVDQILQCIHDQIDKELNEKTSILRQFKDEFYDFLQKKLGYFLAKKYLEYGIK